MNILALDIGTSSVKAAVLNQMHSQPIGPVVKQAYPLHQPDPETVTIDPKEIWQAIGLAAREASAGQKIEGIGISCLTPCLVLLDDSEQVVIPFVTHLDRRARPMARTLEGRFGSSFLRDTGNRPLPGGISAAFFAWWAQQNPDQVRRVHRYLHLNSWIALKLTGQTAFDPGNACFTGLCAWADLSWSAEWCAQLGVSPNWLPKIVPGNITVGQLRPEMAQEWNLPAKIPVKIGLADTSSAILAAGMEVGDLLHLVGTTQVLAMLTDEPHPSPHRLLRHFGLGDSYLYVTHNPVGGAAFDWFHHLCFADKTEDEFFGPVIETALEKKATAVLDPLFLGGDRLEIEDKRAAFKNLTLATDRFDLLAALLSGMRAGHRQAYNQLERSSPPRRVFLSGGGAKIVHKLLPEYGNLEVIELEQASLLGVAKLFA
jgi:xylulokinase